MSEIKYKLSDLISRECIEELEKMEDKILNCGNDNLIIELDGVLHDTAILEYIKAIHTSYGNDANKEVYIICPKTRV